MRHTIIDETLKSHMRTALRFLGKRAYRDFLRNHHHESTLDKTLCKIKAIRTGINRIKVIIYLLNKTTRMV